MAPEIFHYDRPFTLESGEVLPQLDIAYNTWGDESLPVAWVCHALTASSDVEDWWPGTVTDDGFLNPKRYRVVCANILGSHYGTTGPLSVNPATGRPYYGIFPSFTIRDIVATFRLLAEHLGIGDIDLLVGSSVGGFQAIEWAVQEPHRFKNLALIATAPYASPWAVALDETQRMAIRADASWGEPRADAAMAGMAAARAIGLLSYRGGRGYNLTQQGRNADGTLRAVTYQRHQGDKICRRYNAYSYVAILDAFDTHDVGRDRGGLESALQRITARTLLVGITTDLIFPPEEIQSWGRMIAGATYREIDSPLGHDGFLVEKDALNQLITSNLIDK